MTTKISFTTEGGKTVNVDLSAKNIGTTSEFSNGVNYKHRVSIKTERGKSSFLFHTSQNDYKLGKFEMDEKDLQGALYCFLSDAASGKESFGDFCNEFGYDTDSRKALKVWKDCQKATEKAERLFEDVYEAVNAVNELENA